MRCASEADRLIRVAQIPTGQARARRIDRPCGAHASKDSDKHVASSLPPIHRCGAAAGPAILAGKSPIPPMLQPRWGSRHEHGNDPCRRFGGHGSFLSNRDDVQKGCLSPTITGAEEAAALLARGGSARRRGPCAARARRAAGKRWHIDPKTREAATAALLMLQRWSTGNAVIGVYVVSSHPGSLYGGSIPRCRRASLTRHAADGADTTGSSRSCHPPSVIPTTPPKSRTLPGRCPSVHVDHKEPASERGIHRLGTPIRRDAG